MIGLGLLAGLLQATAAPPPEMALWRLDCGRFEDGVARPSPWAKQPLPVGCYLVRHGDDYLLWDAGVSARALDGAHPVIKLDRTITDQLRVLKLTPERIGYVGISHYHGDHTGQAAQFAKAKLLIGAAEWTAIQAKPTPGGAAPTHLAPWIDGKAPVEALVEDHDVFGDGRVMVLRTPGHTPGHSALLVKLAGGNVILAGDLWETHDAALTTTMPDFNTSRAETLASRERIARMGEALPATIIVQHEVADIAKLPAFPQPAK